MKNVLSRLKKRNYKIIGRAVFTAAAALIFYSCAAIPEKADMPSGAGLLPDSVNILISTRVDGNLDLIQPVLDLMAESIPADLSSGFIERTDKIWAGLELLSPGGEFRSSMAAEGDYPKGLIEWALFWDSYWNKEKYKVAADGDFEMSYWADNRSENQIAFPSNEFLLASGGDIETMLISWAGGASASNREWLDAEAAADVVIMTKGLSQEEYSMFVPELKKVPLESLILTLKRIDDDYHISGTFHMDSGINSFLFATIFRTMVITARTPEGERQFTNLKEISIEKDGDDVNLKGMKLPASTVSRIEREWLNLAGVNKEKI